MFKVPDFCRRRRPRHSVVEVAETRVVGVDARARSECFSDLDHFWPTRLMACFWIRMNPEPFKAVIKQDCFIYMIFMDWYDTYLLQYIDSIHNKSWREHVKRAAIQWIEIICSARKPIYRPLNQDWHRAKQNMPSETPHKQLYYHSFEHCVTWLLQRRSSHINEQTVMLRVQGARVIEEQTV